MRQAEKIRAEPSPLPNRGPYRAGIIDIPWASEPEGDGDRAAQRGYWPFPTLTVEQSCQLQISKLMHTDAVLLMWVTNFILLHGLHIPILQAWGFEPKQLVTWPKDKWGHGKWLRGQTEHVVMAVRGEPVVESASLSTLLKGPFHLVQKSTHSAKPKEFYDFVEKLCPAPRYADLFSRYQHNDKWDCHGDEAPRSLAV
jgi:N6-adenosine-specific RNA methylase IME4